MTQAKSGDTVVIDYTYALQAGNLLRPSAKRRQLEFTIGSPKVITGLGEAVIGMSPGESATVEVPADKAYGPRRKNRVFVVDLRHFPEDADPPELGQILKFRQKSGKHVSATVTGTSPKSVRMDANHPLAGRDLVFDIKLVAVS